jgi:hypothetical protein
MSTRPCLDYLFVLEKVLYHPEIRNCMVSCVWMYCQIYFYVHGAGVVEDWMWLCATVPRGCLWINYQFSYHWLISILLTLVLFSNSFKVFLCSSRNTFSLVLEMLCGRNANWWDKEVCFMEAIMLHQVRGTMLLVWTWAMQI